MKKRAVFERESSVETPEDASSSRASAIAAANRRSGEFSSTFKSRLSTFEASESAASASVTTAPAPVAQSAPKASPDPQFKTKLATFHRAASGELDAAKREPVAVTGDHDDRPDFKAKLAAFRQVEETMKPKATPAGSERPVPPAKPVVERFGRREAAEKKSDEPIYANSSVALGLREAPGDAESSDCTEDEGIRSLSPHGTPSPTSPSGAGPVDEPVHERPQASGAFSSFRSFGQQPLPSPPRYRFPVVISYTFLDIDL